MSDKKGHPTEYYVSPTSSLIRSLIIATFPNDTVQDFTSFADKSIGKWTRFFIRYLGIAVRYESDENLRTSI